jgi:general secretion pathway protein C
MKRLPLIADFVLFIGLCVSAAYWGMQLFKPQVRPVTTAPQAAPVALNIDAAAGLFGGRPTGAVVASNFQLKGVIAAGPEGVAILSADGKPPQAVGVNMEAAPGVTLKEVHPQYVLLNEGGLIKRVDLPEGAKSMELGGAAPVPVGPSGASMPKPTMEINNGQMPSEQPPVNNQAATAPPGPQPIPMQPMMPPPQQLQPGPNEAPNPKGGIPGGGHPGLQK